MHITDTIRIEKLSTEDTISKENAIQFQSFITSLDNFYKAAILRENDRQDVCRKTMLIADKHIHILGKHIYIDKKDAEKILKNLNFIKSLNTKKAFYYLSFFTAYFSGDKLFDILSVIDETFLEEDIDTIMF